MSVLFLQVVWRCCCFNVQESKRVCAGRRLQRSTPTRPASTRHCAHVSRICSHYQVSLTLCQTTSLSDLKIMQQTITFSTVHQMVTSTKTQSTTCVTVSPATSCGVTRLITREENRLVTTPCPSDGAASPSGEKMTSFLYLSVHL